MSFDRFSFFQFSEYIQFLVAYVSFQLSWVRERESEREEEGEFERECLYARARGCVCVCMVRACIPYSCRMLFTISIFACLNTSWTWSNQHRICSTTHCQLHRVCEGRATTPNCYTKLHHPATHYNALQGSATHDTTLHHTTTHCTTQTRGKCCQKQEHERDERYDRERTNLLHMPYERLKISTFQFSTSSKEKQKTLRLKTPRATRLRLSWPRRLIIARYARWIVPTALLREEHCSRNLLATEMFLFMVRAAMVAM